MVEKCHKTHLAIFNYNKGFFFGRHYWIFYWNFKYKSEVEKIGVQNIYIRWVKIHIIMIKKKLPRILSNVIN